MSILQAAVLGVVQGLTEFLPISSSGHLVLVPAALGWAEPALAFDVLLHVGSLVALLAYFSGDLVDLVRGFFRGDGDARRLVLLLVVGTIPAAIAGVLLGNFFEKSFADARSSAIQLIITALILVVGELFLRYHERRTASSGARLRTVSDLRTPDAGAIGVAQAIAILPGISRSGSTIATGLALSVTREDAARFSFLLAIPALFGAAVVKIPDIGSTHLGWGSALLGFATSLVVSYLAIAALIRYLKTNSLYPFAVYCVIAGITFYFLV